MNRRQAYQVASQWGSYMRSGDPGACFYGFKPDDGRPQTETHRQQCIAYAGQCRDDATRVIHRRQLQRLVTWFKTCDLATTN